MRYPSLTPSETSGIMSTPKNNANSIEVARLAGVSQPAVSRVFRPGASRYAAEFYTTVKTAYTLA